MSGGAKHCYRIHFHPENFSRRGKFKIKQSNRQPRRSIGDQHVEHKSKRGGARPGAGRKPGKGNKPTFSHHACAAALANAVEGKPAFLFIAAMRALEAPIDDVREALGLTREAFVSEYGQFVCALAEAQRAGMATIDNRKT